MGWWTWEWQTSNGRNRQRPDKGNKKRKSGGASVAGASGSDVAGGGAPKRGGRQMVQCTTCPAGLSAVRAQRIKNGSVLFCTFCGDQFKLPDGDDVLASGPVAGNAAGAAAGAEQKPLWKKANEIQKLRDLQAAGYDVANLLAEADGSAGIGASPEGSDQPQEAVGKRNSVSLPQVCKQQSAEIAAALARHDKATSIHEKAVKHVEDLRAKLVAAEKEVGLAEAAVHRAQAGIDEARAKATMLHPPAAPGGIVGSDVGSAGFSDAAVEVAKQLSGTVTKLSATIGSLSTVAAPQAPGGSTRPSSGLVPGAKKVKGSDGEGVKSPDEESLCVFHDGISDLDGDEDMSSKDPLAGSSGGTLAAAVPAYATLVGQLSADMAALQEALRGFQTMVSALPATEARSAVEASPVVRQDGELQSG